MLHGDVVAPKGRQVAKSSNGKRLPQSAQVAEHKLETMRYSRILK
jgi:hypothetical protein